MERALFSLHLDEAFGRPRPPRWLSQLKGAWYAGAEAVVEGDDAKLERAVGCLDKLAAVPTGWGPLAKAQLLAERGRIREAQRLLVELSHPEPFDTRAAPVAVDVAIRVRRIDLVRAWGRHLPAEFPPPSDTATWWETGAGAAGTTAEQDEKRLDLARGQLRNRAFARGADASAALDWLEFLETHRFDNYVQLGRAAAAVLERARSRRDKARAHRLVGLARRVEVDELAGPMDLRQFAAKAAGPAEAAARAAKHLRLATDLYPPYVPGALAFARFAYELGDYGGTRTALERAFRFRPDDGRLDCGLARLLTKVLGDEYDSARAGCLLLDQVLRGCGLELPRSCAAGPPGS